MLLVIAYASFVKLNEENKKEEGDRRDLNSGYGISEAQRKVFVPPQSRVLTRLHHGRHN